MRYINGTSGRRETDDLFRCWVEVISLSFRVAFLPLASLLINFLLLQFSARVANVAKNKVHLADEVEELKLKGKSTSKKCMMQGRARG